MNTSDHICTEHLDDKCRCQICGASCHEYYDNDDGSFAASGKRALAVCIRCGYFEDYYSDTGTVMHTGYLEGAALEKARNSYIKIKEREKAGENKIKIIELTYADYIPNEKIKKGDVFHGIYEIASLSRSAENVTEWKVYHRLQKIYLRMIRPDPEIFLNMPVYEQQMIVSLYQQRFIPMQMHPRIERFFDVRHIGGSAAFFTEWCERGTLAECITNGSLYQGEKEEVDKRLVHIVAQTARALQFLEERRLPYGIVSSDNIIITDRFNAKLSMANLLTQIAVDKELKTYSDEAKWAVTALEVFTGERIDCGLEEVKDRCMEYANSSKFKISEELLEPIVGALYGKLPGWQHVFACLKEPLTRDYPVDKEAYDNNHALRLIDCGKWEAARKILVDLAQGFPKHSPFRYNRLLLDRYISEEKMSMSYGGVCVFDLIFEPTDILLFAEWNEREYLSEELDNDGDDLPACVSRYLPEIHEKLLDRPDMTCEDIEQGDPRIRTWGEEIVIELDSEPVTFKPLPEGCEKVNIPGKDGLVWDNDRLILPDSGIIKGIDYTVRKFEGSRFLFDEGYTRLLAVSGNDAQLYPLAQFDNLFRAPFLGCYDDSREDEI